MRIFEERRALVMSIKPIRLTSKTLNNSNIHLESYGERLLLRGISETGQKYEEVLRKPNVLRINITGTGNKNYGIHLRVISNHGGLMDIKGKTQKMIVRNDVVCIAKRPLEQPVEIAYRGKIVKDNSVSVKYIENMYGIQSRIGPTVAVPTIELKRALSSTIELYLDCFTEVVVNGDVAELETNLITLCTDTIASIGAVSNSIVVKQENHNNVVKEKENSFDSIFKV